MKIYLAGGFYQDYKRDVVIPLLEESGFACLDPETKEEFHSIPGEYVGEDFALIREADLVLAYRDGYPFVYGMAAEVGYAVACQKPVILIDTNERVDSFLAGCARAVFTDFPPAVNFIIERYGKKS